MIWWHPRRWSRRWGFWRWGSARRRRGEDGMVTAELATALPVLVVLVATGVAAAGVVQSRVRCADAAREAARAVARGEPALAGELASRAAGRGVEVVLGPGRDTTTVTVRMPVHPLPWLPTFTVSESAVLATEPGRAP